MTGIFEARNPRFRPWYRKRTSPRAGAPDDESGVMLPVRLLLAATSSASVILTDLVAYSTGLEFMISVRYDRSVLDPMGGCRHYHQDGDPDRCLRIGLQFNDGTKVTSLDHLVRRDPGTPSRVLKQTWGGGGGATYKQRWWVWPLPPPGPVLFVLEWPAVQIERVIVPLDGDAVRTFASQSIRFWEAGQ